MQGSQKAGCWPDMRQAGRPDKCNVCLDFVSVLYSSVAITKQETYWVQPQLS